MMKLILKQSVENLGKAGEVIQVKPGFGRNYLIPQGLAVLATPSAKKVLAETLKQRAHKEQKLIDDAQAEADKLNGLAIKISAKVGEGDKLFGSVSNADLAEALAANSINLDKKYISVQGGLVKRVGKYEAKIRFHREVIADFAFDVVAEAK
jgi:large subunit ribosomal protein L9